MKLILPIVILFLQSCLFSGSTSETPDDTRKADVANTAKDVGLDSKKMDMSDDVSKKIDASDMSSDVEDDMKPECTPECVGDSMICVDGSCVCDKNFVLESGSCVCDKNFVLESGSCVCPETSEGFGLVGDQCTITSIVKNVLRTTADIKTVSKLTSVTMNYDRFDQVVPFLSARSTSKDPQSAYIIPKIDDRAVNKITLSRSGNVGQVDITVSFVEFDERHIKVHSGEFTLEGREADAELGGIAFEANKAFLVFYVSPQEADLTLKDTSLRGVVSKNKIEFNREEDGGVLKVHWSLIVSLGDAFEVDHVEHVIKNNQRHSALTNNDKDENALFLWSNTTTQTTYSQGHTRCQYLSADPSSVDPASTRCSRGKESDLGAGPPPDDVAITIALQKIHFQNLTVNHYEPVFDSKVNRAIKPGVRGDKDTAISGQLGSAGTVTKSASGSGSDEHPAMCTIKLATNVEGVEIIEIKRAAPKGIAQASVQHIKWY